MTRSWVVCVCVCALFSGVALAKSAKRPAKPPSGDGLAKAVFVGEVFSSGYLYLYSLQEKQASWPKEVSFFAAEPTLGSPPPVVSKARLDGVTKGKKIGDLEEGKSSVIVAAGLVVDFVRYKTETPPQTPGLVVAVAGFEVESATLAGMDVPRSATPAEKTAADRWYADWKRDYRKAYNEEYDPKKDEVYGRPETLVDAKALVSFTVKAGQSARVSRFNTRTPTQQGLMGFVVDVLVGDKIVKTTRGTIPIGPLG